MKSMAELAADWRHVLTDKSDGCRQIARLLVVERKIANATIQSDADKLAAMSILLEKDDQPDFADPFKTKLWKRLQMSARRQ